MYRQINTKIWHDPKVKKLSAKNKLLFMYFLTNNHTHMSGIYYIPIPIIEHEVGIKRAEVIKGIDTLSTPYLIRHDEPSETVWVVNMLKYQGKSEKVCKSVSSQLSSLHRSLLIKEFLEYYNTLSIPYQYPIDTLSTPDHIGIGLGIGIDLGIDSFAPDEKAVETKTNGHDNTLDEDLERLLLECPNLSLVATGESSDFWDRVIGACEGYGDKANTPWLFAKIRAWDQWFDDNASRKSRTRKSMQSRLFMWLCKDLEKIAKRR